MFFVEIFFVPSLDTKIEMKLTSQFYLNVFVSLNLLNRDDSIFSVKENISLEEFRSEHEIKRD